LEGHLGKGCGLCSRLWRKWQIGIGKLFAGAFYGYFQLMAAWLYVWPAAALE